MQDETEESEEGGPNTGQLLLETAAADDERTQKKVNKYRVQLKTILDALAVAIDDESVQERLRRKEFRAAQGRAVKPRSGTTQGSDPWKWI